MLSLRFDERTFRASKPIVWLLMLAMVLVAVVTHATSMSVVVSGDRYTLVKLSSDGQFVTFVDRTGEHPVLRRQRVGADQAQNVVAWPAGAMNYQVARDGSSFLLFGHGKGGAPSLSYVSATDLVTHPVEVQGSIAGFGGASVDDFVVLTQDQSAHLHVLHIAFGSGNVTRTDDLGDVSDVAFDGSGRVRAVRSGQGVWGPIGHASRQGQPAPASASVVSASNDGKDLWFTDVDAKGFKVLRRLNVGTQQWSLASNAKDTDVSWITVNPKTGGVDGYAKAEAEPQWVTMPDIAADVKHLTAMLMGVPYVIARSSDDRIWLFALMSSRIPVGYYTYDRSSGRVVHLFWAREFFSDEPMLPSVARWIRSADGTPIQVLVSPPSPQTCHTPQCPFVVKLHGGPHHRDDLTFDPETYWLQSLGYWVVRVNFRGSIGFGDVFAHASNREWGRKVIEDVAGAVDWFVQTFPADKTKGAAMGGSFGGFAAMALATSHPDAVRCVASLNGGGDLEAFATLLPQRQPHMAGDIREEVGDVQRAIDLRDIRQQSPAAHIDSAKAHFLVEYGEQDTTSVSEESSRFAQALRQQGKPVLEVIYHNEGHELTDPDSRRYHFQLLSDFLSSCFEGTPLSADQGRPGGVSLNDTSVPDTHPGSP
jgi:pimeloyl-ACP methyl ester carboxylesterase